MRTSHSSSLLRGALLGIAGSRGGPVSRLRTISNVDWLASQVR